MIGRSIVILQRGDNKNEIHLTNSWDMCSSAHDPDIKNKIIQIAKEKSWVPEDIVSDAEVAAIVTATNDIGPQVPGYHKWAGDSVLVINLSNDPNLYNPATVLAEQKEQARLQLVERLKQLQEFIPELYQLSSVIPTGNIEVKFTLPVTIVVKYSASGVSLSEIKRIKDGKSATFAGEIIDHDIIRAMPELANAYNCPYRKAYEDRCNQLAILLGLTTTSIKNKLFNYEMEMKKKDD